METVLRVIAGLSFLAFVVGMIRPAFVGLKGRGKVALIYLAVFIISVFVGASLMEDSVESPNEPAKISDNIPEGKSKNEKIPVLTVGSVYTLPYADADVKITFENIQVKRIPNDGLNLVFTLVIKNESNDTFFISDCGWKLLNSENIEVEESGIYDPAFGDFMPDTWFFTTVEPNIGKKEKVGYSVKEETYYLSINGKIIAQIPLDKKE